jgi:hypothetical protein
VRTHLASFPTRIDTATSPSRGAATAPDSTAQAPRAMVPCPQAVEKPLGDQTHIQTALEQTGARVEAARKARDLAQRTFEIMKKEQTLGAGSTFQTMTAQRDLAIAELDLVTAMTIYEKAKVELDRATGSTLEHNGIRVQDAMNGTIAGQSP